MFEGWRPALSELESLRSIRLMTGDYKPETGPLQSFELGAYHQQQVVLVGPTNDLQTNR